MENLTYLDISSGYQYVQEAWNNWIKHSDSDTENNNYSKLPIKQRYTKRRRRDPTFFEVRDSVCIVGLDNTTVQTVKAQIAKALPKPIALESLTARGPADVSDGALLVPKIIIVVQHVAGKLLLDMEGDEGLIDWLYDEVCEVKADLLMIYRGLPSAIYPHMKHMVYHPRMMDLVFPNNDILRSLAENNCFITTVDEHKLNLMQKNVILEWLEKPVGKNHPVYATADYLSSVEYDFSEEINFYTDTEIFNRRAIIGDDDDDDDDLHFVAATEEHPLADRKVKKKKKKRKFRFGKKKETVVDDLVNLEDDMEMGEFTDHGEHERAFSFAHMSV